MKGVPRYRCPSCGIAVSLSRSGTVWPHNLPEPAVPSFSPVRCPGSGRRSDRDKPA